MIVTVSAQTQVRLISKKLVIFNGRLQLTLLGGIAQWEREMMLERQKIGIAKAKSDGKYKGRVPTARRIEKEIQSLHLQGMKPSKIAKDLTIGVESVYRYRNT